MVGTAGRSAVARLIVCERTGRWAVALRRELADAGVRVWETRTLAGCREELEQSPASFVALELTGDLLALLRFMVRQSHDFPAARLAAVDSGEWSVKNGDWQARGRGNGTGTSSQEAREVSAATAARRSPRLPLSALPSTLAWVLREAGAVHFVDSIRRVAPLARLACRHLAQVPPPQQSLSERIWTNLPWG